MMFRSGGSNVKSDRVTATTTMNNLLVYNNSYTISQLSTSDDGDMYQCRLNIRVDPVLRATDSISLDVIGKYFTKMNFLYMLSLCIGAYITLVRSCNAQLLYNFLIARNL